MNPNESWIAEQARLLELEDGFGPDYAPRSKVPAPEADPDLAA